MNKTVKPKDPRDPIEPQIRRFEDGISDLNWLVRPEMIDEMVEKAIVSIMRERIRQNIKMVVSDKVAQDGKVGQMVQEKTNNLIAGIGEKVDQSIARAMEKMRVKVRESW